MTTDTNAETWSTEGRFRVDATEKAAKAGHQAISVGTAVSVYGDVVEQGTILAGPNEDFLFAGPAYDIDVNGNVVRRSAFIVVTTEDFNNTLHLFSDDNIIIAGGPGISHGRLLEIQQELGSEYPHSVIR